RVVRHMETAATRHANKIDVKRDSKGPQSYAYH
ncbi:hypothetical protein ABIC09_007523, partial [Bradyrhizobium sp. S3.12.5]